MKMKIFITALALLGILNSAKSFETVLNTQTEVDQMINFTSSLNDIVVRTESGQTDDLITNLDGLGNLDSIRGLIIIDSVFITTLEPLSGLKVRGIGLLDNPYLEDISALSTMTIDAWLNLHNNDAITTEINNDLLPVYEGVFSDPSISLVDNDGIESINIQTPDTFSMSIVVNGNSALKTMNLEGDIRSCSFHDNERLEYLYYQTTKTFMGNIEITGNSSLTIVKGFSNIEQSGVYRIYDNPMLENMCFLQQILNKTFTVIIEEIYNNGAGANSIDEIMAQDCNNWLSVDEATQNTLSVYPNPTHGILNIQDLQQSTSYRLINLQGQLVQQGMAQPNQPLHLEQLPSGIYFLELEGTKPVKVVKQ